MNDMEQSTTIGQRVRSRIAEALPDRAHATIADEIGMTPDAFSRSLNDKRAFSSVELALLADLLGEDIHWLITGEPDPLRVRFAARHAWNEETQSHEKPGNIDDNVLGALELAYKQAHTWRTVTASDLPSDPAEVRRELGDDFVLTFADRVEQRFGIDVVRIQGLSTDYSFVVGDQRVIVLKTEPQWYRVNWSIAHELAHLALGHHDVTVNKHTDAVYEAPANRFASELLLPEADMNAIAWADLSEGDLANLVWTYGVSTQALANRLGSLGLFVPPILSARPEGSTLRLLRRQRGALPTMTRPGTPFAVADQITYRYNRAAERRIPEALVTAHLDGIATGRLNKGTLAWLLDVSPNEVEVDEPPTPEAMSTDDLMAALGI